MKYNWSIIGHEDQLNRLEHDLESGNLSHAYLLTGPNSVGKFTVAKKLAGILQCDSDFCHKCPACVQVQQGSHLDTVELLDDGESIKVAEVRRLIERVNMTRQSKYKVFLIQSVERMTTEAANSFLKVLEEPPERTIFIMTTNNLRGLLPTIVSRVRVVKFHTFCVDFLRSKIKELYPDCDSEIIEKVSLFSMGKTGKALRLMERPDVLAEYMEIYHDVQNFLRGGSIYDRFSFVEELLAGEHDLSLFFNILTNVVRTKMLSGGENCEKYVEFLGKIEESATLMKKNVNNRLVLENLMLNICGPTY